jgi:hypothetical protein
LELVTGQHHQLHFLTYWLSAAVEAAALLMTTPVLAVVEVAR